MNIHRVLLLCVSSAFVSSAQYGEPEGHCYYVSPRKSQVYSATEGGTITVTCSLFSYQRGRKRLWRDKCDKLLADTDNLITEKYAFAHVNSSAFNVSITRLTESDSGRYTCAAGASYVDCQEFDIAVTRGVVTRSRPYVYLTMFFLLVAVCLLPLYKHKTAVTHYVNTRWNHRNKEISADYDDCVGASTGEGSAYQNLDPHSRDVSLYFTLQSDYITVMSR